MTNFIGIDLGTTFSAVSTLDDTGRPQIVLNNDEQNITPSCVTEIGGTYYVGEEARKTWGANPQGGEAAARFKRDMGTDKKHRINGKELTPTELSALVLKKLNQDTAKKIGDIGEAVVTIPANFSNKAREATMIAAKSAGINISHIINEPTAAALYYSFKEDGKLDGIYAVYDLGGGTFDVSIIHVKGQNVEVLATDGSRLGGHDFDKALIGIVEKKYRQETGETMEQNDFDFNDAEEEKKSLSKRQKVTAKANRELITVTREEFEESISTMVTQAEMLCESVMEKAKIAPSDIVAVFLAGGSTRVPLVKESVRRVFQQEPVASVNVDEVVSLGAALYAAYKGDQSQLSPLQKRSVQKIKMEEITSKCFGTITLSNDSERGELKNKNDVLIEKGEKIPCSVTSSYYTVADGQEHVRCDVTESNAPEIDPDFVTVIWSGRLSLPPGRPIHQEILVTFSYDENQIMHCSFVDAATGKKQEISLSMTQSKESSDINDIEKFIVE